jgi:hypothetical protein
MVLPQYDTWTDNILEDIRNLVWTVRNHFYGFTDTYRGHWLLGWFAENVSEPIGNSLDIVGLRIDTFRDRLYWVDRFVHDILDKWLIDDIIQEIWADFWRLTRDPSGWVSAQLTKFMPRWTQFITQTKQWVIDWIEDYAYWIRDFLDNPVWWFREVINAHMHNLYTFWQDPWKYIEDLLYYNAYDLWRIMNDFDGVLKDRLADWFGFGLDFWDRPFDWFTHAVLRVLETGSHEWRDRVYKLGQRLLRYFWEGVW